MTSAFPPRTSQVGHVVPDLGAAIDGWKQLGVGPFLTMHNATIGDHVYRGHSCKPKLDIGFGQNGDLMIELIQQVNDEPSS
jgi:hypothetical protein